MRKLLSLYVVTCALLFAAWQCFAQLPLTHGGLGAPASGACSQYSTFIARTSGTSGTEQSAYQTMICGMVTDGTWSLLDAFYIFATNSTTTANLNLVSTSFTLSQTGTVTFSADHGYTGDGSTGYLDTGFTPSGSQNFTQNSASLGAYNLTSNTTSTIGMLVGSGFPESFIGNAPTSGQFWGSISGAGPILTGQPNSQGSWGGSRTASSTTTYWKNGTKISTDTTDASTGLPSHSFTILAENGSSVQRFAVYQLSAAWIGAGMTDTQEQNVMSRINAYMTALSINVY